MDKSASISNHSFEREVLDCLKELGEYGRKVTYPDVVGYLDLDEKRVVGALFSLRKKEMVSWSKGGLGPDDNISVTKAGYQNT